VLQQLDSREWLSRLSIETGHATEPAIGTAGAAQAAASGFLSWRANDQEECI
jgi:hypothetical protein